MLLFKNPFSSSKENQVSKNTSDIQKADWNSAADLSLEIPAHQPPSRCVSQQTMRAEDYRFAHLLCPFCRKLMLSERSPILLECGHSFCKSCVYRMPIFDSLQGGSFDDKFAPGISASLVSAATPRKESVANLIASLMFGRPSSSDTSAKVEKMSEEAEQENRAVLSNGRYLTGTDTAEIKYGYLRCLECREKTNLKDGGLDDLEVNSFLGTAADRALAKMSICADCENASSRKYCEECGLYLCAPCSRRIHSGMITSQHRLIELDEHTSYPISSVLAPTCPNHPRQEAILYCTTCEQLACILGAYGIHKQHDMALLNDAIGELKLKLQSRAQQTKGVLQKVVDARGEIDLELKRLKETSISAKAFVSKQVYEITKVLQGIEREMCECIEIEERSKHEKLKKQEMDLEALETDLKLRVQLANTVIKNPNAAEMVEPTNRQIKTLQGVLNDIPNLELATSHLILVKMDKIISSMNELTVKIKDDQFPRDPSSIRMLFSEPTSRKNRERSVEKGDQSDDLQSEYDDAVTESRIGMSRESTPKLVDEFEKRKKSKKGETVAKKAIVKSRAKRGKLNNNHSSSNSTVSSFSHVTLDRDSKIDSVGALNDLSREEGEKEAWREEPKVFVALSDEDEEDFELTLPTIKQIFSSSYRTTNID